ncbi:hypothetical protein SLA2020_484100 [Shorea laevis]
MVKRSLKAQILKVMRACLFRFFLYWYSCYLTVDADFSLDFFLDSGHFVSDIFSVSAKLNPDPIEEDEEGHGWVFCADQMVDEAGENEDSEWDFSHNPVSSIGQSNGNHDLARSVLQINDQRFEDAEEMEYVCDSAHQ